MPRTTPPPADTLTGRRLGRKPTPAEIEAACEQLRRLSPDSQKVAVWFIDKLVSTDKRDEP